jgi:hypothetical protein
VSLTTTISGFPSAVCWTHLWQAWSRVAGWPRSPDNAEWMHDRGILLHFKTKNSPQSNSVVYGVLLFVFWCYWESLALRSVYHTLIEISSTWNKSFLKENPQQTLLCWQHTIMPCVDVFQTPNILRHQPFPPKLPSAPPQLLWEAPPTHPTSLFPQQPMNFIMSGTREGRNQERGEENTCTKPQEQFVKY